MKSAIKLKSYFPPDTLNWAYKSPPSQTGHAAFHFQRQSWVAPSAQVLCSDIRRLKDFQYGKERALNPAGGYSTCQPFDTYQDPSGRATPMIANHRKEASARPQQSSCVGASLMLKLGLPDQKCALNASVHKILATQTVNTRKFFARWNVSRNSLPQRLLLSQLRIAFESSSAWKGCY